MCFRLLGQGTSFLEELLFSSNLLIASETILSYVSFIGFHSGRLQSLCCFFFDAFRVIMEASIWPSGKQIVKQASKCVLWDECRFFISSGGLSSCTLRLPPLLSSRVN
jgi:hypothetical protein